mmetsp:Transcript_13046/g.26241  ORF Transcript_13046/g.26241 Transcript_13046/m.26241 type:complete len:335 (+) Transcript_13046:548-1552(+)
MLVASKPAFSASVRGTTSRARPNFWIAYWSKPGCASPNRVSVSASNSSVAPAPGTKRLSFVIDLTTATPSSMARSTSSITLGVEPRMMIVATRDSSSSWSKMVQRVEPISFTWMCLHLPRSTSAGGSRRTRVAAPVVRQMRRSSNFEGHFMHMILYFSRKCSANSPTCCPQIIMLQPVSAMALMTFSSASSSELLYALSSSALLRSTVPLVSVVAESSGMPYTATLASCTSVICVMTPRVMHMPRTTDVLRIELPGIFATRTLSVLKLRGLEGIARMHASAILAEKRSSLPYCFDAMTCLRHLVSFVTSWRTSASPSKQVSLSSVSRAFCDAAV